MAILLASCAWPTLQLVRPIRLFAGDDVVVLDHLGSTCNLAFDELTERFRRGQLILNPLIVQAPLIYPMAC
jgi:hypothetical protein